MDSEHSQPEARTPIPERGIESTHKSIFLKGFAWGALVAILVLGSISLIFFTVGTSERTTTQDKEPSSQSSTMHTEQDAEDVTEGEREEHNNRKHDVIARLDKEGEMSGCYPRYPIDIFIKDTDDSEVLVYNDWSLCSPGASDFSDGGIVPEPSDDSTLLTAAPYTVESETAGTIVEHASGDAGHTSTRNLYIPFEESRGVVETWLMSSPGTASSKAQLFIAEDAVQKEEYRISTEPASYTAGSCEETTLNILINDEVVWEMEGDAPLSTCVETVNERNNEEVIEYRSFSHLIPTNEDLTQFELGWGDARFCFSVDEPIASFALCENTSED